MAGAWGAGLTCGWGRPKNGSAAADRGGRRAFHRGDVSTKSGSVGGTRPKGQASGAWQTTSMLCPSGPVTNAA